VRKHPWAKFGTGHRGTLSAYGRSVAQAQAQAEDHVTKTNGVMNGNGVAHPNHSVGAVNPANALPALPSESDADGGPVGRETRRRLMEWWENEYCAGRMRLAIVGRGKGEASSRW
jgi:insulysin